MKRVLLNILVILCFAFTSGTVFACDNCDCGSKGIKCACKKECKCKKKCNCEDCKCMETGECTCSDDCKCKKRILKIFKRKCKCGCKNSVEE